MPKPINSILNDIRAHEHSPEQLSALIMVASTEMQRIMRKRLPARENASADIKAVHQHLDNIVEHARPMDSIIMTVAGRE